MIWNPLPMSLDTVLKPKIRRTSADFYVAVLYSTYCVRKKFHNNIYPLLDTKNKW